MGDVSGIDASVAHPARRYDYWLGGKDNFAADRESGDAIAAAFPAVRIAAIENRRFLRRAVAYLSREAGVRQFLDIGTGIPTADNTHQVAQKIAPESRIVYVDNDPIVLSHARALLTSTAAGRTAYVDADLRDPESILGSAEVAKTLDLGQPVGLMLIAVLHFVRDEEDPWATVRRLMGALPAGSYLALNHATNDHMPPDTREAVTKADDRGAAQIHFRSRDDVAKFFDGLAFVEPGLVPVSEWRDDTEQQPRPTAEESSGWAGVARIP